MSWVVAMVVAGSVAVGLSARDLVIRHPPGAEPAATVTSTSPAPTTTVVPWSSAHVADLEETSLPKPNRLMIPDLGIDAAIIPLGVAEGGNMALPENVSEVGWYRHGATPAQPGSAVLAAHVDMEGSGPGVFFHLDSLEEGSTFAVGFEDGTRHSFRVVSTEEVPKSAVDMDELFTRRGKSLVRLVTCGGAFDRDARSYEENIIVTAVGTS
ncbi:MAG: sortase [Acidimicrobiia bacterium]|nr:sortase [Acidimicrobiia bacterium]